MPRIHRALEGRPGVQTVTVDLNNGVVTVVYEDRLTSPEQLRDLLTSAGFPTNGQAACRGWRRWLGRC